MPGRRHKRAVATAAAARLPPSTASTAMDIDSASAVKVGARASGTKMLGGFVRVTLTVGNVDCTVVTL